VSKKRSKKSSKRRSKKKSRSKKSRKKKGKKKASLLWRITRVGLLVGVLSALLGGAAVATLFWHWSQGLPELFSADDYNPKQVTRIYDRHGNVLLELYDEKRTVVPLEEIPETMRYAMIAAEDAKFYEHKGLDYIGVLRAAYTNIRRGGFSQGASTITQQVVKNLLLTPEKELKRKVQEVLLARRLEEVLSKDEILWIYLNHVYFGHRNYGVEEAARFYFNKHANALDLNEAATLAGLVQSPERLSPRKHPEAALERRNYVLRQMRDAGFITEDVYRETLEAPIEVRDAERPTIGAARHFVEKVRRDLIDEYGKDYVYTAGLEVHTTVDLGIQAEAERALREGLHEYDARHGLYTTVDPPRDQEPVVKLVEDRHYTARIVDVDDESEMVKVEVGPWTAPLSLEPEGRVVPSDKKPSEVFEPDAYVRVTVEGLVSPTSGPEEFVPVHGPDGALVSLDPRTREVVAVVGGYDYGQSSFNRALQARRQTGSSFKPIVYAAALDAKVITPATIIDDAPKVFHIPGKDEPWSPRNFDSKFKGPMSARRALAKSRNTVAVDVLERVGIDRAVDFAERIGIETEIVENFTMALGSSELTALESANAFATFAAGGMLDEPVFVTRIARRDGEVLYEHEPEPKRVIGADVAFLITSMMRSVATEGTARRHLADWEHTAVGKTGTTNGPKDAWFIGYTPYYVTAVYVGYDQPKPLGRREGGSKTALPIWARFMKPVHESLEVREFEVPPGVIEARIAPESGLLAGPHTKRPRTEYFLPGTVPTEVAADSDELSDADWTMRQLGENATAPAGGETDGDEPLPDERTPSNTGAPGAQDGF